MFDLINKRALKDLESINLVRKYNIKQIDLSTIQCQINGPDDTPYKFGNWRININFPKEYPFKSPSVGFIDKIYHPNIDLQSGTICLNVLNSNWSPIYTISHILEMFIPQLLTYPNPDDPLNEMASDLLKKNNLEFNKYVNKFIAFRLMMQFKNFC